MYFDNLQLRKMHSHKSRSFAGLAFFASSRRKVSIIFAQSYFFSILIFCSWGLAWDLLSEIQDKSPAHNFYNWSHESNIDASSQLGAMSAGWELHFISLINFSQCAVYFTCIQKHSHSAMCNQTLMPHPSLVQCRLDESYILYFSSFKFFPMCSVVHLYPKTFR